MRNPALGLILANLGKNTALQAVSTPNSGTGNLNLRAEFLFYVIYMLTGDKKSERNLHNVAKKSHVWDTCIVWSFMCEIIIVKLWHYPVLLFAVA
jgi:hypothetical protein